MQQVYDYENFCGSGHDIWNTWYFIGCFFGTFFALYAPSISQIGENIVNQLVVGGTCILSLI